MVRGRVVSDRPGELDDVERDLASVLELLDQRGNELGDPVAVERDDPPGRVGVGLATRDEPEPLDVRVELEDATAGPAERGHGRCVEIAGDLERFLVAVLEEDVEVARSRRRPGLISPLGRERAKLRDDKRGRNVLELLLVDERHPSSVVL